MTTATHPTKAGPFTHFFRALHSAIAQPTQPNEKPRSHPTKDKHDRSSASNASNPHALDSQVPAPPNRHNVVAASETSDADGQETDKQYGVPVPGKSGLVVSPFAPDSGYVDVSGFPPGTKVRDPYTDKIFLTP
jgi:hypothetical protein